ncbi:MAG: rhodanese-like domain-containing protein [Hyphomonadaceae bacterium]
MMQIPDKNKVRILALAAIALSSTALVYADNESLDAVHKKIVRNYPDVSHIRREALDSLPQDTLYFDVREPDEYSVSHIAGAVQVSPAITAEDFQARFGDQISRKTAVFYCSVGRRSSRLIDRLEPVLEDTDATAYNLEGSIFRWHNDRAPLANTEGETSKVHPYNWLWSRHLDRRSETSYEP